MKFYLAMCSLSLLIGAALGYLNGKNATIAQVVESCDATYMIAFRDDDIGSERRYHCFDIGTGKPDRQPANIKRDPMPVI